MTRTRELYMDAEVKGRTFRFEDTVLTLVSGEEPEIISAYFAEKKIENIEEAAGTHTYTFINTTNTKDANKDKIASVILKKVNSAEKNNKKHTTQALVRAKLTEGSYAKDAAIAIDLLKTVEKVSYPKLTSAPMGYQVYLIVETKKLKDKKAKVKIREKEEGGKLLKSKDDALPVLVFAKKEDTTTNTEVGDWIEIDVKEENGKKEGGAIVLYKEDKGDKIEVGIKKIQLRPKEDKIKTEGEDAVKSFEGWQEALYIRENETEEGKKATEDAKALEETRKNETFITLTRDTDADKKENKKSFPKKISGPKTIEAGKDAVYTIDTYGTSATEGDKKNIRWSFYVQGEPKTTTLDKEKTYIDAKNKSGWYTYAKMEMVDNKNKLTIVFDKALIGKKVQIEAFRGSPDVNNAKDYVRTTTVQKVAASKIAKRETTSLWLQTQCDSIENAGEVIDKEFKRGLKMITPDTIHIYYDGKMSLLKFDGLSQIKYLYHDDKGDCFHISTCNLIRIKSKAIGKSVLSFRTETAIKTIDYAAKNVSGVDAKTSRIYSNGDVITDGKKYGQQHYKIEYKCFRDEVVLVHMKKINRSNKPIMKFHFHQTLREYSNPFYFGAFIGALADIEFDVSCGGSCYEDGSAFPSLEHSNGYAIDTGYKYKKVSDEKIIKAMKKFGFNKRIRGSTNYLDTLTGHTKRDKGNLHDFHLHCGSLVINEK